MFKIFNTRTARLLLSLIIMVCLTSVAATRFLYQTSIEAVVNAPRILVEAPVDGVLGRLEITPGRTAKNGAVLLDIRRDEFSRGSEDELGTRMQALRERATTLETQITSLRAIRDSLRARVRAYRTASVAQLQATQLAADTKAIERTQNLERTLALRSANGTTLADVERARSDALIAGFDASSARAALDAAQKGIVTAQGAMDVPYSQQRVDELAVQITNLLAELSLVTAELRDVERTTSGVNANSTVDGTIAIRATVDGVVWAMPNSPGAHVTKGAALVTLIDCSRLYLDATISPREQDKVVPGAAVRLRFAGTSREFPGTVEYVRGGGVREDGQSAAQLTLDNRHNDSHAIIHVDPDTIGASPGNFCQVGRSAKVIFDGPNFSESSGKASAMVANLTARARTLMQR